MHNKEEKAVPTDYSLTEVHYLGLVLIDNAFESCAEALNAVVWPGGHRDKPLFNASQWTPVT